MPPCHSRVDGGANEVNADATVAPRKPLSNRARLPRANLRAKCRPAQTFLKQSEASFSTAAPATLSAFSPPRARLFPALAESAVHAPSAQLVPGRAGPQPARRPPVRSLLGHGDAGAREGELKEGCPCARPRLLLGLGVVGAHEVPVDEGVQEGGHVRRAEAGNTRTRARTHRS